MIHKLALTIVLVGCCGGLAAFSASDFFENVPRLIRYSVAAGLLVLVALTTMHVWGAA